MSTRWAPGACKLLAWDQGLALLDGTVQDEQAESLWRAMQRDTKLGVFLQVLMETTGSGLLNLPPFAVTILDGRGAHVAVRGSWSVLIRAGDQELRLNGEGITTWEEKLVAGATLVEIQAPGRHERSLPIVCGIADAGWVMWTRGKETPARAHLATDLEDVAAEHSDVEIDEAGISEARRNAGPVATLEEPSHSNPEPSHSNPEPSHSNPEPSHSDPEPSHSNPEPSHSNPEPPHSNPEPPHNDPEDRAEDDPGRRVVGDETIELTSIPKWLLAGEESNPEAGTPHDGVTVAKDADVTIATSPENRVPKVLAVFCRAGHPNPPQRVQCYQCNAPVGGQPQLVERPQLGWLRVAGGETVPLRGPVVAGRNPRTSALVTPEAPRLIALPHQHVSSSHIAFIPEGWSVLVRDLGSSNGSYLRRHGNPPIRLPESDVPLVPGDVIDLGHGVFINLDRIP